jgi:hypothetical protein
MTFTGDLLVTLAGRDHVLECKSRKASPLYNWLMNHDALILKADRQEPLVVLRLADVLRVIEQGSTEPGGCHARRY